MTLADRPITERERAESVGLWQGEALVNVRRLGVRGMPLVATLRTPADVAAFLAEHPERRRAGPCLPVGSTPAPSP